MFNISDETSFNFFCLKDYNGNFAWNGVVVHTWKSKKAVMLYILRRINYFKMEICRDYYHNHVTGGPVVFETVVSKIVSGTYSPPSYYGGFFYDEIIKFASRDSIPGSFKDADFRKYLLENHFLEICEHQIK
jgi:hypothetical protein